jgi:hypothetical protein
MQYHCLKVRENRGNRNSLNFYMPSGHDFIIKILLINFNKSQ